MSDIPNVAIFWDYENCNPPSNSLGYDIVNNMARIARLFGSVTTFRAYLDISAQSAKSVALRSQLQSSGVSMIDCPHNGKKDVVDKMILGVCVHRVLPLLVVETRSKVDMLAFAVDHSAPATIILVAGDRDYAYAVSILKLRRYKVVLVVPSFHASSSLESQASLVIDWSAAALRSRAEPTGSPQVIRQPCFDLDADLVTKLLKELREPLVHDAPSTASQNTPRPWRVGAQDLLEPSKYSRNTGISDSTHEFAHTPASPCKAVSMGNDLASGGLPVSKTPPHSGFTRAHSASAMARSPVAEHDLPVKSPLLPDAERPSASTFTPSFGSLGMPFRDSRPPSSMIIRSPPEPSQSTVDMPPLGRAGISSSRKLSCLASPFVMPEAPTKFSNTSHTVPKPVVYPMEMPAETVNSECRIPQMEEIEVSKEIDCPTGLCIEDNSINLGSIPHRARGYTCALGKDMGLHLADPPLSKHFPPPAATALGIGDSDDSAQSFTRSHTPNTSGRYELGSRPTPLQDEHQTWKMFRPLILLLFAAHRRGIARPSRSTIALDLLQSDKQIYQHAGVTKFRDYTALAEQAGLIELGGREGDAWIALHPNWFGMDGNITTAHFFSNRVSSPPPKVIQDPLLTGFTSPLTQGVAISQIPSCSSESSGDWQNISSRASIPAQFKPLINILLQLRAEGSDQTLRSVVGQLLSPEVYVRAGVSGFKEYVFQASEAQLVQFGGIGGHAWIGLHPELCT